MKREINAGARTLAVLLALSAGSAQAVTFRCKPLLDSADDAWESMMTATAINNRQQAVGYAFAPSDGTTDLGPAQWGKDRQAVRLDDGAGGSADYAIAYDINDAGQVVGESSIYPNKHALTWINGILTELPGLPGGGDYASASSVNRRGRIVGFCRTILPTGELGLRATLWIHGQPKDLGALNKKGGSIATDINDAGMVVGRSSIADFDAWVPARWIDGKAQALPIPEGAHGGADAVSETGAIVGQVYLQSDRRWHAYAWQGDAGAPMGALPGSTSSAAHAINDSGMAVGAALLAGSDDFVAVYWPTVSAQPLDLNSLVDQAGCVDAFGVKHRLSWAADINDKGVVVANSTVEVGGGSRSFSFRLTPR